MKIAFHADQIGLRGTEVALYDYADYCERLLGYQSVIIYDSKNPHSDPSAVEKFRRRFPLIGYEEFTDVDRILAAEKAELIYFIKVTKTDCRLASEVPTAVHAVFTTPARQAHGAAFAYVSQWLADKYSNGRLPSVPHMVTLPQPRQNLRRELGIPKSAFVLGCHGGPHSFNIAFARKVVAEALQRRADLYFVAMNIEPFCAHPHAMFLPGSADPVRKADFIECCDAMLHARENGETFGLACGEFSLRNKPVITYSGSRHRAHIDILGPAGVLYRNARGLGDILLNIDHGFVRARQWDRYSKAFSPQAVIPQFDKVFVRREAHVPARAPTPVERLVRYQIARIWPAPAWRTRGILAAAVDQPVSA
ncbi:MAG: hypothetical protein JOZ40_20875 [Methylobacteriaceae bacterium]|nr:hypothetical protein [Methylobacteriaceae bacterium]